jgi:hypothetical protein
MVFETNGRNKALWHMIGLLQRLSPPRPQNAPSYKSFSLFSTPTITNTNSSSEFTRACTSPRDFQISSTETDSIVNSALVWSPTNTIIPSIISILCTRRASSSLGPASSLYGVAAIRMSINGVLAHAKSTYITIDCGNESVYITGFELISSYFSSSGDQFTGCRHEFKHRVREALGGTSEKSL